MILRTATKDENVPSPRTLITRLRHRLLPAAMEAAGMSKTVTRKQTTEKQPKTKLGRPDLDHSRSAVLDR
jgi:hypothetical protein